MYINPKLALEQGWIDGIVNPDTQIQPNAIDFTIDTLFSIDNSTPFIIDEDHKQMRGGQKVDVDAQGYWIIEPNTVHDALSNIYVNLPEGVAANLIIRSTLNRNGLFLTSGLYDSGFKGNVGFALHNMSGVAKIKPGTRVGQIILTRSDPGGLYAGGYNHEKGTHWNPEGPGDFNEQK